ncbi:zinc finger protein on ecdysone puffs-like [Planococcus citri]|uniref:zinc finger protein on ecdysone puffs-like n=1 Tax=Planococcus citri TaxID=170843 RepID=UPI0031F93824
MTFRGSSRGFRSPRGTRGSFRSRGTFRGRGQGSNSYYESNNRGSFNNNRGSFRGGSSYRGKNDSYESRDSSSSSKYSGDRYSSSHSRREEGSHHHREVKESASGSYGRDHSRRDGEPERKRVRSEIGSSSSYKEGISPRRSYDDLDHSNHSSRSYSSTGSPYRSESSSFAKSHHHRSKEYSEFKKPLPPAQDSSYRGSSSRGFRGRGITRSTTANRMSRSTTVNRMSRSSMAPSYVKRSAVGRISTRLRPTPMSRTQQLLRKKKQIRLMRIRKLNEARGRPSKSDKPNENNTTFSEEEDLDNMEVEDEEMVAEELDQSMAKSESSVKVEGSGEEKKSDSKKSTPVKKEAASESESPKKTERKPINTFHKDHIALKCLHCKIECSTFKRYAMHLNSYRHKTSMDSVLYDSKQKLRKMRAEQRNQQRVIDEKNDDFAKTSYCRLCKLNYKQTKQEHFTSDHHINLNEFLNPRCSVCHLSFETPILYEHHKCTLNHIKRKAFLERKGADVKDGDKDEENNDDDNFMVLDSVGSADEESGDETQPADDTSVVDDDETKAKSAPAKKKKLPKVVGAEFIKRVPVYYCKLCRLCLPYNPNTLQEDLLLAHCRGRFHLKLFSTEKLRRTKQDATKSKKSKLNKSGLPKDVSENNTEDTNASTEVDDSSAWDDTEGDHQKSSDDEEAGNRFDRFGHSEELENATAAVKSETNESNGANESIATQA